MGKARSAIWKFRHSLEVDPESLQLILDRLRADAEPATNEMPPTSAEPEAWERLTWTIKQQLPGLDSPESKLQAISLIGEIYEHECQDPERAFRFWGQMLGVETRAELAYQELERLAEVFQGWSTLAQIYSTALKRFDAAGQKVVLHRLAWVHLAKLGDTAQAERLYLSLLQKDGGDPRSLAALDALYTMTGQHEELAGILRKCITNADSIGERTAHRLRLGALYAQKLDDPGLALEIYRNTLEDDANCATAQHAYEEILIRLERWEDLLTHYESRLAYASDETEVADLFFSMARICEEALDDRARSATLWRRLLALQGDDRSLLESLAQRFESMERWEELAVVLENLAALEAEPSVLLFLHARRGELLGQIPGREQEAIASWHRVLQLDPLCEPALRALAESYRRQSAWTDLLPVLYQWVEASAATGNPLTFIADLYAEIGRIELEEVGNQEQAIEAWSKTLSLNPVARATFEDLVALLSREGRWIECIALVEQRLTLDTTPAEQVELLFRAAAIWRDGLDDISAAVRGYHQVLAIEAGNVAAFDALCIILREQERFEELVELTLSFVEHLEDQQQVVSLLYEVAALYEDPLHQPEKAFVVWQSVFREDRGTEITRANLERLAVDLDQREVVIALYQEAMQMLSEGRVKAELLVTLSRWYLELYDHVEEAIGLASQALHLDPEHLPALEALEEGYHRGMMWSELAAALHRHAELETRVDRASELLCAMAEIVEIQLGDSPQAITIYQRALKLDAQNERAFSALGLLFRQQQQWVPLLDMLRQQLSCSSDPEQLAAWQCEAGEIFTQQLGDLPPAILCYQEALKLYPHHPAALSALAQLYEASGEREAYLDIQERHLELPLSPIERQELALQVATAWEAELGRPERAIGCLEQALAHEPQNELVYQQLARLCLEREDSARLVATTQRHIAACRDPARRVDLYLGLGEIFEKDLVDEDRAIVAYRSALAIDAQLIPALQALVRLYQRLGQTERAMETLRQLMPLVEGPTRGEALYQMGCLLEEHYQRPEEASALFEQVLAIDEQHLEAMLRLINFGKEKEEWTRVTTLMLQAETQTSSPLKKAQLLYEAAQITLDKLGDEQAAMELFGRTLHIDPDHLPAGIPLARIYYSRGRYDLLEPVLDMVVRKIEGQDRALRLEIFCMLGRTAAELNKIEKAIRYYEEARLLEPLRLSTLQALSALQFRAEVWSEAQKTYQTLLVNHRPELDQAQMVEAFYRLGTIKEKLGELRKAVGFYEKAVEQLPTHRPSLEALSALHIHLRHWEAVVAVKMALLATADATEQSQLLEACGDIFSERLQRPDKAIETYHAASSLLPENRALLHKLLDLLSNQGRWQESIETLRRLAAIDPDRAMKARYFNIAAEICRDELHDSRSAVAFLNAVLDHAPGELGAFDALEQILINVGDWTTLEQDYRRMLERVSQRGEVSLRAALWHNLGQIYRTRLEQPREAISAFEAALELEPENLQRLEILAELYLQEGPETAEKAITAHRQLLSRWPERVASYRALLELYTRAGDLDSVCRVCAVLALLRQTTAEEQELYRRYKQATPSWARRPILPSLWKECILFRAEENIFATIFALLSPFVLPLTARPPKVFGLKRQLKIKRPGPQPLVGLLDHISEVLGILPPALYSSPDSSSSFMVANTTDLLSVVLHERLLQLSDEKKLAFTLGQQLAFLRPEFVLLRLFPAPAQVRTILLAALKLIASDLTLSTTESTEVEELVSALATQAETQPSLWQELTAVGSSLMSRLQELTLAPYWKIAVLTADRVGLIFSNDLEAAARAIKEEPTLEGQLAARDRVKELLLYSVSSEYTQVRHQLGLALHG